MERVIAAEPGPIFDLLADPSRHRDIDGSGTVRDAVGGSTRLSLGARFGMGMRVGASYEMTNEVVEFEPDRRIAWQARPAASVVGMVAGGRIWRYELEPVAGGTRVRESWDISQERIPPLIFALKLITRRNMDKTLARIDKLVT
ncbi:MAG: SRPBCC family protein [Mycobacteriales bacterium]